VISQIQGIVLDNNEKYIVVNIGGIGFKIYCTSETKEIAKENEKISLFTHLVVKEDALDLYGFITKDELNFFELLISISGIGPKTALNVLNITTVSALKKAITSNDTSHLIKVSGIGKKIAEKIVLELKDKVGVHSGEGISLRDEIDAVEALKALGYSQKDAREALQEVDKDIIETGARIKSALKILGK
jgi:holliday junction DNA helicase RuvA